ncbi:CBS domain-containing protein [Limimaricola pyoseonensis]|uniref:CBS domain-containing protein n=1 Tax=Limimaricola pyoseonensis TaxID=521013 RepID=A0A1G7JLK8_9RHOB|nr:CBS domain-containing protein [Limimaricola pyoseonensis]SDF25832.1 CBS domain-containing protein [Limimaricola pyoseonensis]
MRRVADIMSRDVVSFAPETEILRAVEVLVARGISGAPVVDADGRVLGMLSQKDCLRAAIEGAYHREWGGPVSAVMSRDVKSLPPDLDLLGAARVFAQDPYRRYPVVSDGRLLGMVSRSDVLAGLLASWAE